MRCTVFSFTTCLRDDCNSTNFTLLETATFLSFIITFMFFTNAGISNGFVIKYERLKDTVKEKARRFKNGILFLLPFKTKDGLNSELEYYKGNYSDKRQSVKNNDLKF